MSVYLIYSANIYIILVCARKYSLLYRGDSLRLTICACYTLEMALNVGPDVSLGNR
jgi:hypothetical protein